MDANSHPIKVQEVKDAKFFANTHPYKVEVVGGGGGTSDYEQLSNLPKINGIELKGDKTANDLDLQKSIKRLVITPAMVISQNPVKIQLTDEMNAVMTDLDTPYVILDASAVGIGSTVFAKAKTREQNWWQLTQIAGNFQIDTQHMSVSTEQTVLYNEQTKIGVYEEIPLVRKDDVVNTLNSTSTENPLSANMGKELGTEIANLKNIGRFCAIWDASAGSPTSESVTTPYLYKVGDYFRIGVAGYKVPTGSQYNPGEYDLVEEETGIGDVWYYDGVEWVKQASSGGGTVQDVQVNGTSVLNGGVANVPVATSSAAGVLKVTGAYGTNVTDNGELKAEQKSYVEYGSMWNDAFISKGTLENVFAGKGLDKKVKVLTTADYNYPTNNPTGIASWRLEPGVYVKEPSGGPFAIQMYSDKGDGIGLNEYNMFLVYKDGRYSSAVNVVCFRDAFASSEKDFAIHIKTENDGVRTQFTIVYGLIDNLTTASSSKGALDAHQGKVLKDLIDANAQGVIKTVTLTQTQYDALTTYADNTNYQIIES